MSNYPTNNNNNTTFPNRFEDNSSNSLARMQTHRMDYLNPQQDRAREYCDNNIHPQERYAQYANVPAPPQRNPGVDPSLFQESIPRGTAVPCSVPSLQFKLMESSLTDSSLDGGYIPINNRIVTLNLSEEVTSLAAGKYLIGSNPFQMYMPVEVSGDTHRDKSGYNPIPPNPTNVPVDIIDGTEPLTSEPVVPLDILPFELDKLLLDKENHGKEDNICVKFKFELINSPAVNNTSSNVNEIMNMNGAMENEMYQRMYIPEQQSQPYPPHMIPFNPQMGINVPIGMNPPTNMSQQLVMPQNYQINPQMTVNQQVPVNTQIPVNTQMHMAQQFPVNRQFPMNQQMSVNQQIPIRAQIPINQTIPVNSQVPTDQQIPINQQVQLNSQVPVNTQMPVHQSVYPKILPKPCIQQPQYNSIPPQSIYNGNFPLPTLCDEEPPPYGVAPPAKPSPPKSPKEQVKTKPNKKKNKVKDDENYDTDEMNEEDEDEYQPHKNKKTAKKKRGRKPGSKNKPKEFTLEEKESISYLVMAAEGKYNKNNIEQNQEEKNDIFKNKKNQSDNSPSSQKSSDSKSIDSPESPTLSPIPQSPPPVQSSPSLQSAVTPNYDSGYYAQKSSYNKYIGYMTHMSIKTAENEEEEEKEHPTKRHTEPSKSPNKRINTNNTTTRKDEVVDLDNDEITTSQSVSPQIEEYTSQTSTPPQKTQADIKREYEPPVNYRFTFQNARPLHDATEVRDPLPFVDHSYLSPDNNQNSSRLSNSRQLSPINQPIEVQQPLKQESPLETPKQQDKQSTYQHKQRTSPSPSQQLTQQQIEQQINQRIQQQLQQQMLPPSPLLQPQTPLQQQYQQRTHMPIASPYIYSPNQPPPIQSPIPLSQQQQQPMPIPPAPYMFQPPPPPPQSQQQAVITYTYPPPPPPSNYPPPQTVHYYPRQQVYQMPQPPSPQYQQILPPPPQTYYYRQRSQYPIQHPPPQPQYVFENEYYPEPPIQQMPPMPQMRQYVPQTYARYQQPPP